MYYGTQLSSFSQTPLNWSDTNSGPLPATPTLTQCVFGRAHDLIPSLAISTVIIGWILANFTHRCSFWNSSNAIHNCNYSRKVKQKSNPGGKKPVAPPPYPTPSPRAALEPCSLVPIKGGWPGGQRSRPLLLTQCTCDNRFTYGSTSLGFPLR